MQTKYINYGTAGFRYDWTIINDIVAPKIAHIIIYLCMLNNWKTMGVMITASHNPVNDNGIKFVDETGEVLCCDKNVEKIVEEIVNNNLDISDSLNNYVKLTDDGYCIKLILGYDTRPSSKTIKSSILKECAIHKFNIVDVGQVTTPILHVKTVRSCSDPIHEFAEIFIKSLNKIKKNNINLIVDCANGVGSIAMEQLVYLKNNYKSDLCNGINIELINNKEQDYDKVNSECGAEYVHKNKCPPRSINNLEKNTLYASLDGDADRLILFHEFMSKFSLIDGDRIGALISLFIKRKLNIINKYDNNLLANIGFIQTAYANSGSTNYIRQVLNINTVCVATGVKHLHKEAKKYDVGIYFEANGHGTVLFKDKFIKKLVKIRSRDKMITEVIDAVNHLLNLNKLINKYVGDAISCLLAIIYIIIVENISLDDISNMYEEYFSKQSKIYVPNKNLFVTNENETRLIEPYDLQKSIDLILEKINNESRAFIRPSGTEDCIRLYVESNVPDILEVIENEITRLVL